jgi:hypothetical protein
MNIRIGALAALAALTITGIAAAFAFAPRTGAQEPEATPAAAHGARRTEFIERVAANLGVEPAQLEQAIRDARLAMIDEALASGAITDEQAERARQRVNDGKPPRPRERHHQHARRAAVREGIVEHSAAAIGVTPEELRASLRAGSSIADVAASHDVPLGDVKSAILDAAGAKLDRAVANGRIDRARADEMLAALASRLDELLQRKRTPPVEAR